MNTPFQIDPGALRHRVTIEAVLELPDGAGGLDRVWSPVANIWAAIEPVSQRSFQEADQTTEDLTHRIVVRHRADLASGWRLRYGERLFELLNIRDPDERGAYLECLAREDGR